MSSFFKQVYEVAAQIPYGKVATYGQIAAMLGNPRGARTVGWAMQGAPEHLQLPCHRVVNKQGAMSPGYAFGGAEIQRAILESEGVQFDEAGYIRMENHLWRPNHI